ncbi:hypothetical protein [Streptomyces sp. RerS4]|uniref:hypothetical protein n=1 Tax=Streptomyces sp. RerS4 TaxID=2942449 RepID=UPI00201C080A|nr:hypothetical protein [Streptomyces sp. RerS4]UQX04162.1 hypothetical protein M4D82_29425 [Streptomyces sp. RerS4]
MIRTAIVATGGIAGPCHIPALRAQAHRAVVVAAVDVDAARAEEPAVAGTFTTGSTGVKWEPPDDLPSSHTAQLAGFPDGYEAGIRPDLGRSIHVAEHPW